MFGDLWTGFAEHELHLWLESAGFKNIEITIVDREEQPPNFETILASGEKQIN
jgi:ArsR family transcriptional regulator